MFTTPCFIRKDSKELRNNLEKLGYHRFDAGSDTLGDDNVLSVVELDTHEPIYSYVPYVNIKYIDDDIDCGTNEELFLAIAALRDDSDKNQWFVSLDNCWFFSTEYSYTVLAYDYFGVYDDTENFHKATVKELIEHFKG